MSGGGSLLRNIDKLLTQVTGRPCHVAENALNCVALGTGLALEHFDFFKKSLVAGRSERRGRVDRDRRGGDSAGTDGALRRPPLPHAGVSFDSPGRARAVVRAAATAAA